MELQHLRDLMHAVKNMNDDIKEVKFEMWDGGHSRISIGAEKNSCYEVDYFNAVNFEELEDILSQMLSL